MTLQHKTQTNRSCWFHTHRRY